MVKDLHDLLSFYTRNHRAENEKEEILHKSSFATPGIQAMKAWMEFHLCENKFSEKSESIHSKTTEFFTQ